MVPLFLHYSYVGGVNPTIRSFIKECSTWSKLRHPHVAQFFGLYRTPEDEFPLLIMEKMETMMPGTHAYMAPEAELGLSCDYTEKVDIFSFGVLIIHTLTHQLPVPGPRMANEPGTHTYLHQLTVCTDLEVELLHDPIQRCLMFNPDDRIVPASLVQHFQTVQDVVGVSTIGNITQCKDCDELRDKLLHVEMTAKEKDV